MAGVNKAHVRRGSLVRPMIGVSMNPIWIALAREAALAAEHMAN